jgi:hypothetical protein
MARTYRDIAIEEMLGTVQEAMSQVIVISGACRRKKRRCDLRVNDVYGLRD